MDAPLARALLGKPCTPSRVNLPEGEQEYTIIGISYAARAPPEHARGLRPLTFRVRTRP